MPILLDACFTLFIGLGIRMMKKKTSFAIRLETFIRSVDMLYDCQIIELDCTYFFFFIILFILIMYFLHYILITIAY